MVIDVETQTEIINVNVGGQRLLDAELVADEKYIQFLRYPNDVGLVDSHTGEISRPFPTLKSSALKVFSHKTKDRLIIATYDNTLEIWDTKRRMLVNVVDLGGSAIQVWKWKLNVNHQMTVVSSNSVILVDVISGKILSRKIFSDEIVGGASNQSDKMVVLSVAKDESLSVADLVLISIENNKLTSRRVKVGKRISNIILGSDDTHIVYETSGVLETYAISENRSFFRQGASIKIASTAVLNDRQFLVLLPQNSPSTLVEIWEVGDEYPLKRLITRVPVRNVDLISDKFALLYHIGGTVSLWDLDAERSLSLPAFHNSLGFSAFVPEKGSWITAGGDMSIRFWQIDRSAGVLQSNTHDIPSVHGPIVWKRPTLIGSENYVIAYSKSGELYCWDSETLRLLYSNTSLEEDIEGAFIQEEQNLLISWYASGKLKKTELDTGEIIEVIQVQEDSIGSVQFVSELNQYLAFSGGGSFVLINDKSEVTVLDSDFSMGSVEKVLYSHSTDSLIVAGTQGLVAYEISSKNIKGPGLKYGQMRDALLLPDNKTVLTWGRDGYLIRYNVETDKIDVLADIKGDIKGASFNEKLNRVMVWYDSRGYGGTARAMAFDLYSNNRISPQILHGALISSGRLLNDAERMLVVSKTGGVRVYNISDGVPLVDTMSHNGESIRDFQVDEQSNRLLTLTGSSSIHLWDLDTGVEIYRLPGRRPISVFNNKLLTTNHYFSLGKKTLDKISTKPLVDISVSRNTPLTSIGTELWDNGEVWLVNSKSRHTNRAFGEWTPVFEQTEAAQ